MSAVYHMFKKYCVKCAPSIDYAVNKSRDTYINDVFLLESSTFRDERGSFNVIWEGSKLSVLDVSFTPESVSFSHNKKRGTLRGLHYQEYPYGQSKLVSCAHGSIFDVVADMRPESSTYLRWASVRLTSGSGRALFIPAGFAHGFLTLEPDTTVAYLIEGEYHSELSRVVRWNDPIIGISWPFEPRIFSERDLTAPDLFK